MISIAFFLEATAMNKQKLSKIIYWAMMCMFCSVFIVSSVLLLRYAVNTFQGRQLFSELAAMHTTSPDGPENDSPILEELQAIYELNNDLVGWIKIEGTNIDYPVMETPNDSDYYLHTSFYHEYADEGCIYVRAACDVFKPSDNITIYGHNMLNGSMFRHLHKYKEKSFYEDHKYIQFDTLYERHTYEIIAVFQTSGTYGKGFAYHMFDTAKSATEFDNFVSQCKALSLYDIETTAEFGDKLITLSTCDKTALENGRLVVIAKRIS
jgi:sortase B